MSFCQSCGAEHSGDASFCPACGSRLGGDGRETLPAPPPPPPPSPLDVGAGRSVAPSPLPPTYPITPIDNPIAGPPITPPPPIGRPGAPPSPLTAGAPRRPKSLAGLTTTLTVLFIIAAVISTVGVGLGFSAVNDAAEIRDQDRSHFAELLIANNAQGKIFAGILIWSLVALAVLVLLIIWTHRAHRNLQAFGAANPKLPTGMAVGSWFIPLFWFLGPYWCIADAYKGAVPNPGSGWRKGPRSGVTLTWWLLFCAANAAFGVGTAVASDQSSGDYSFGSNNSGLDDIVANADRYAIGWTIISVGFVLSAAAAILGALAVRAVGTRQEERIHTLAVST